MVLGDETKVGSYCEVEEGTVVGRNVILQGRIRTGEHCKIEDNVTIKYGTILTSNALLKKNCFMGPQVINLHLDLLQRKFAVYNFVIRRKYLRRGRFKNCRRYTDRRRYCHKPFELYQ